MDIRRQKILDTDLTNCYMLVLLREALAGEIPYYSFKKVLTMKDERGYNISEIEDEQELACWDDTLMDGLDEEDWD